MLKVITLAIVFWRKMLTYKSAVSYELKESPRLTYLYPASVLSSFFFSWCIHALITLHPAASAPSHWRKSLRLWYSESSQLTGHISTDRSWWAGPQAQPQTHWIPICLLTRPPGGSYAHHLERHCSDQKQEQVIFSWQITPALGVANGRHEQAHCESWDCTGYLLWAQYNVTPILWIQKQTFWYF